MKTNNTHTFKFFYQNRELTRAQRDELVMEWIKAGLGSEPIVIERSLDPLNYEYDIMPLTQWKKLEAESIERMKRKWELEGISANAYWEENYTEFFQDRIRDLYYTGHSYLEQHYSSMGSPFDWDHFFNQFLFSTSGVPIIVDYTWQTIGAVYKYGAEIYVGDVAVSGWVKEVNPVAPAEEDEFIPGWDYDDEPSYSCLCRGANACIQCNPKMFI